MTPLRPIRAGWPASDARRSSAHRVAAVALVEVLIGSLVLAGMIVATLGVLETLISGSHRVMQRARYSQLATALLEEILANAYADEAIGSVAIGPEAGEIDGTRAGFDDVDDYHGWYSTPPIQRDGTPVPGFDGVARRVIVQPRVTPDGTADTDGTYKQITVIVEQGDTVLYEAHGLRSRHP